MWMYIGVSQQLYSFWCCTWPRPGLSPGACDVARLLLSAPGPAAAPASLVLSNHKPAAERKTAVFRIPKMHSVMNATRKTFCWTSVPLLSTSSTRILKASVRKNCPSEWLLRESSGCWGPARSSISPIAVDKTFKTFEISTSVLGWNGLLYSHGTTSAMSVGWKKKISASTLLEWAENEDSRAEKDNQSHGMMSEGARRPLNQIKSIYIRGLIHNQVRINLSKNSNKLWRNVFIVMQHPTRPQPYKTHGYVLLYQRNFCEHLHKIPTNCSVRVQ